VIALSLPGVWLAEDPIAHLVARAKPRDVVARWIAGIPTRPSGAKEARARLHGAIEADAAARRERMVVATSDWRRVESVWTELEAQTGMT
jgi:hypothetical protein